MTTTIRLAHVSDIHITVPNLRWYLEDWFNKRLAAWVNLRWLGRGKRFRLAEAVLTALLHELRQRRLDHVVFSGDATALGFEEEMIRASVLLGLYGEDPLPGIAVPGNHDYCTPRGAGGVFERHFESWQWGERVSDEVYPFAQRVGHLWLVGVNSATANRLPWDASGAVGRGQLERLRGLLKRLDGGPRVLVTHYPVCLNDGRPEHKTHCLRDLADVVRVAAEGGVSLWLHGHRHDAYQHIETGHAPFPVICAGSSTQNRRWSYGEYTITGQRLRALRRVFDLKTAQFYDGVTFELDLPA